MPAFSAVRIICITSYVVNLFTVTKMYLTRHSLTLLVQAAMPSGSVLQTSSRYSHLINALQQKTTIFVTVGFTVACNSSSLYVNVKTKLARHKLEYRKETFV